MNISKLNVLNSIQQKSTEKQNDNSQISNNNQQTKNIDYRSMPTKPIDLDLMIGKNNHDTEPLIKDSNTNSGTKPYDLELMTGKNTSGEKSPVQNDSKEKEIIPTKPYDLEIMTGKKQD